MIAPITAPCRSRPRTEDARLKRCLPALHVLGSRHLGVLIVGTADQAK